MIKLIAKTCVLTSIVAFAFSSIGVAQAPSAVDHAKAKSFEKNMTCLAQVMHDEARGESRQGKIAVGHVVINRTKTWNRDVCGVVYHKRGKICQFSGMCKGGKMPYTEETYKLAYKILRGEIKDPTNGATYFHATYVNPAWKRVYKKTIKIGSHIFYESKQTL